MRIALLSHTSLLGTGPGEVFFHLLWRLRTQGDSKSLVLLPSDGPLNKALKENRISTRVLSRPPPWYMHSENKPESIANYMSMARQIGHEIANYVKEWGAETLVVNTHTSLSGLMAASQLNLPYVAWLHGVIDSLNLQFSAPHFKWACDDLFIRCATARICPSQWLASVIKTQYNCDASVIPNFTRVPDKVTPLPKGPFTFCCLTSWEPHKRVETILEAARILLKRKKKFQVILHGFGPESYVAGIRERIQSWNMGETVHLYDRIDNPRYALQNSHALLSASQIESFGMTLIEAMSEGRPVIASATTGHLEIVREKEVGFLCPVGDAKAFAERMEWMIRHRGEAAKMGRKAWEMSRSEYSGEKSTRLFVDLLQDVVGRERTNHSEIFRHRYWPCRLLLSFPTSEILPAPQPVTAANHSEEKVWRIGPNLNRSPTRFFFQASKDSLSGFRFQIGTHHTLASGKIQFYLYDRATSYLLRTLQLGPMEFSDNAWMTIEFEPVPNSANRVFQLDVVATLTQGRVAIYEAGPQNHLNLIGKIWERLLAKRKRKHRAFFPTYR